MPPFSHAGRWITDAKGRVVMLHGFNIVAKEAPYTLESVGFEDDDAAFLTRNGVNVVRVGFMWEAVEPKPGEFNDAYLDSIARTVQTLGRHGILSLVDFHDDNYSERIAAATTYRTTANLNTAQPLIIHSTMTSLSSAEMRVISDVRDF